MTKKIIAVLISFIIITSMICFSYAESKSDLKNQQTNLEQQVNETKEELEGVQNEKNTVMAEIAALTDEITKGENEIAEIEGNLNELEAQIKELKQNLQIAQENYDEQEELLEARLVAQYKAGKTSYLDVLLKSEGLQSFISKYKYIKIIAQYDTDLLNQMEEEKNKIEEAKKQVEEKESQVKIAKANKEKANVLLKNNKTLKDNYVAQLSDSEKQLQKEIDEKNAEIAKISQEIAKIEQSSQIKDANYEKYTGGTMAWPTRIGKYVTSIYAPGGRGDSSYAGTAHKGVDIRAPQGTAVYAAADGVVVYVNSSGYGGGWGLYVVISHGNGIYTRYAHASSIASGIAVGTTVTTDTCIMYSGSTGASDAPHLHFEVCQGSLYNQVNPCPYLGIENKVGAI